MRKPKKENFVIITTEDMERIPYPYPQFNCRCVLPEELEILTISETPSSLIFLLVLQFNKN